MLKICRPLSLDPTGRAPCLYLCRRPDVPQALSQSHEKSIYVMGGHNSPDDVLRTKKLLVPRAARASVLWWSYQESQQKKITEEQVEQSKRQLREKRNKRREEIAALHVLEQKMLHEGMDPREVQEMEVVDPIEQKMLNETLESDLNEVYVMIEKEKRRRIRKMKLKSRMSKLKEMEENDKKGVKTKRAKGVRKIMKIKQVGKKKGKRRMVPEGEAKEKEEKKEEKDGTEKDKEHEQDKEGEAEMIDPTQQWTGDFLLNNTIEEDTEEVIENVLKIILEKFWWSDVSGDVRRYCSQFTLQDAPGEQIVGGAHDAHRQLYLASTRNDLTEMQRLVEFEKAGVFARGHEMGESPVHHAVRLKNMKMLIWLDSIHGGIKHHIVLATKQTPTLLAASMGQFQMLQWMVEEKHYPIDAVDVCGMSIVHHAVLSGRLDMVKFLVQRLHRMHPTLVSGEDNNGMTPRELASGNGLLEIAMWLGNKLSWYEGNMQRKRELQSKALYAEEYNPTEDYHQMRATNLMQRYVRRWLAIKFVKKFKQDEKARKQRESDLAFMPASMKKRNSMKSTDLVTSLGKGGNGKSKKSKKKGKRSKKGIRSLRG